MIRLTWRPFRAQGYVALAALVIVAAVVAVTGVRLAHLYSSILFARCGKGCGGATEVLNNGGFSTPGRGWACASSSSPR